MILSALPLYCGSARLCRAGGLRAFQDRESCGVVLCMAETDEESAAPALLQQRLSALVQNHKRLAALFASYFHILPAKLRSDARPEGFRDRFLGCKTGRQKRTRHSVREAVAD